MNTFRYAGQSAEVKWGYHHAAALGRWTITVNEAGALLDATVQTADAFRVSQQPLTLVVPRPQGPPWRWKVDSLQIAGDSLNARLGDLLD